MRVRSHVLTENSNFFTLLKVFLGDIDDYGWAVDAQNDTDIYIHNSAGDYYAFSERAIGAKQYYYSNSFLQVVSTVLMCLKTREYNSFASFFQQPCDYIDIQAINSLSRYYVNCLIYSSPSAVSFCADENNLVICIQNNTINRAGIILITKMQKLFTFDGGSILSSSHALCANIIFQHMNITEYNNYNNYWALWNSTKYLDGDTRATPFCFGANSISNDNFSHIRMTSILQIGGSYTIVGTDGGSQAIEAAEIITNLPPNNIGSSIENAIPFNPERIAKIKSSRYSGLCATVTPYYFFKNNKNKFVLASFVDKFKMVARGNLTHGQEIWYGEKRYLLLDYHTTRADSTYLLAVDITEEN
jgi:hypothetical protein